MALHKRTTWGKYCSWHPSAVVYPTSLEELRQAVSEARASQLSIRLAGSLHTINELCATTDLQIHTSRLCQVLLIDKEKQRVKVQSGIKVENLLKILAQKGLTLPNQGYIIDQTIGGAIATATHGSGNTGTFCSFVEELELLDADGTLHTLNPVQHEHLFSAAVVSLGCLGIVYSLTLKCVPLEKLELTRIKTTLSKTLEQLPDLLNENDFFQFASDPYSQAVMTSGYKITQKKFQNRGLHRIQWFLAKTLAVLSFDWMPVPYWFLPSLVKTYMNLSSSSSCVDYSYRLLSPADEGHYVEEEIAVPLEKLQEALLKTREIIDRYGSRKKRMVAILLIRFANADPYGYLSPALGRKTAYISLITLAKEGYKELFKEIETALYLFEGRPHWGKAHFLTHERIAELYGKNFQQFREARQTLDPHRVFTNPYVDALFPLT